MDRERYRRISELFAVARRMPADVRAAYLAQQSADESLASEVEALLTSEQHTDALLDRPPVHRLEWVDGASSAASPALPVGTRIGRYELLGALGEGAMGVVYRARQQQPRRDVALKVLRAGLGSPELLRRFELEAQLVARLAHPGIAQIYDAGAADTPFGKLPYFAMELVDGPPLSTFVEQRRLNVRRRLELLAAVCDAVQHAHQKGVIHRDLKPANILVVDADDTAASGARLRPEDATRDAAPAPAGQPKILDFGVARLADADAATIATGYGQLLGTIPYMSPEQFGGDPHEIDTRCDVYALGVIGFELLTGRTPHDLGRRPLADVVQMVRGEDPPSLASVDPRFRGDLEIIFRKALERHKELRYASAAELAADIRRHLADEPIAAQPPTIRSQLRQLVRRHRTLAAVSATAALTLMLGAIATTWVAVEAVRARRLAEERLGKEHAAMRIAETENRMHRALFDFYSRLFLRSSERDGGRMSFGELVDLAAESIDGAFPQDAQLEAPVRSTLGLAYQSLGRYDAAERQLREALRLHETCVGGDHEYTDIARYNLAHLYEVMQRWPDAETVTSARVAALRRTLGEEHADTRGALKDLRRYRQQQGKP
ncbi:MAG: serine/threonine protein kinase [Phycisphaerae bacterium]|jgi:serine/threonine protein kinase